MKLRLRGSSIRLRLTRRVSRPAAVRLKRAQVLAADGISQI